MTQFSVISLQGACNDSCEVRRVNETEARPHHFRGMKRRQKGTKRCHSADVTNVTTCGGRYHRALQIHLARRVIPLG